MYRKITALLVGDKVDEQRSEVDVESNLSGEEQDDVADTRVPFVKSAADLFNWVNGVSASDPDDTSTSAALESGDVELSRLDGYEKLLQQSEAYRWLLSKIYQQSQLTFGSPDFLKEVGTRVFDQLRTRESMRKMSRHKPSSLAEVKFQLDWNPRIYAQDPTSASFSSDILSKILCLTGTRSEAQAMTVSEYILQTWPITGEPILRLLEKFIVAEGQNCVRKSSHTNLHFRPDSVF